ncbi:type I-E CRISPR-associated protein Cse1/CasA [Desulfurivibrio dismutans]|uniref:type I-E CRISPR-associated protein Cse1/CasA n=1 Tax=Desulfurivibrio dismutans TaxID=1398908 RepID=UPI0023D9E0F0|nr:type I-E CRISPR-associated protein Cse1/CasA [Desulfurivibrio alkaliphilus]MDF1614961.1 type I-E CRISPR-associated protein Cse1/CasA [Desulfurivibrio alkaliphilus]
MSRFNLIDEQWIPVRYPDGLRGELGIRDTLLRAAEIESIEDPSPLVVAALHRFLLAVLYRALEGPTDIDQAKALFRSGLPGEIIAAYLEKWRNRFWLFDENYPFGQIPTFTPKIWRAWTVLAAEHNADNAKVLFDHIDVTASGTISEAAATRWLLATQTFSVSCGKSELSHTGTAPSATAAMVLPRGHNLQDTLLLALVWQNREVLAQDLPLWEREPESVETLQKGVGRLASGLADRYTWRIRAIRFAGNGAGIDKLAFASGVGNTLSDQLDPMLAYRKDEKKGLLPIQFKERGIWRDFDSLLPDGSKQAPRVIEHAAELGKMIPERFPQSVMVVGQANNKAKIEFWRLERFALPKALVGDRLVREEIRQLLADAEDTQKALWLACRTYAGSLMSRGEREPTTKDINGFIDQIPSTPWYWSSLEARFHEVLREYNIERDSEEIRCSWLKVIRDTLRNAWGKHSASVSVGGDAWAIRALVKAERHIARKMKELSDKIKKLEPHKEAP